MVFKGYTHSNALRYDSYQQSAQTCNLIRVVITVFIITYKLPKLNLHTHAGFKWPSLERTLEVCKHICNTIYIYNREGSDKIIRIQDKSARLVIDSKERIIQETERTLNDGKTFRKEEDNPTKDHIKKVKEWRDKWIEVFDDDEAIWLLNIK